MAEISKPDYTYLWSSGGAIVAPSNVKIQTGWAAEVPPFQWENWSQNRQDQAIAHILQHGIPVWDSVTEYQAAKSYVQGSDGALYKAVTTNTNTNPVGDAGTNWTLIAALPVSSTAQAQGFTNNTSVLTPLRLADAFKGANQLTTTNGYQKLPGGLIKQWGGAVTNGSGVGVVSLPVTFPSGTYKIVTTVQATTFETITLNIVSRASGSFTINATKNNAAVGVPTGFDWIAEGY